MELLVVCMYRPVQLEVDMVVLAGWKNMLGRDGYISTTVNRLLLALNASMNNIKHIHGISCVEGHIEGISSLWVISWP
jgi:hypothetical protein